MMSNGLKVPSPSFVRVHGLERPRSHAPTTAGVRDRRAIESSSNSSLVPQRFDRMEGRGFPCGVPAETGADHGADDQAGESPAPREDHRHIPDEGEDVAAADAEDDPD